MKKKLFIHYVNFRKLIRASILIILLIWFRIYCGFLNTPLIAYTKKLYALVQTYYHQALVQTYYNQALTYKFKFGCIPNKHSYPSAIIQLDSLNIQRVDNSNLQYERLLQNNLQNSECILQLKLIHSKTTIKTVRSSFIKHIILNQIVDTPVKVKLKQPLYLCEIRSTVSKNLFLYLPIKIIEPKPVLDLILLPPIQTQSQLKQQLYILPDSSYFKQPYILLIAGSPLIVTKLRSIICPACGGSGHILSNSS